MTLQRITQEMWATNNYDIGPTGYDDSPVYEWNEGFDLDRFQKALDNYNQKDSNAFEENYEYMETDDDYEDINSFLGELTP